MSSLFEEVEIEVVKITFNRKDNSYTETYYFSFDFHDASTVYSGNHVFYPLLAASPTVKREVGINVAVQASLDIQLFGANDFLNYNYSLLDYLKEFEIDNAEAEIRYYCKPQNAQTTHSDDLNIRQKVRVINSNFDPNTGILSLGCQEVWFKDKEISKKLSSEIFDDIDPRYDGVYGAIVFGQATTAANGIAIDAPFISSEINDTNIPEAKIFSGWTFTNHPNHSKKRLLVRNQYKDFDKSDWLTVGLASDPQTASYGDSITLANLYSDPVSHDRDLSINERALVSSPPAGASSVITCIRAGLSLPSYDRCLDIANNQYLWNAGNEDFLSRGDEDFSFSFWAKFDALSGMVCQQGWDDSGKMEWAVYHDGSNHLSFSISSTGSGIAHTATTASISTSTWYYITCVYDTSVNNKIYIYVNTTAVNTNVTNFLNKRDGRFSIGRMSANPGLDGKKYQFRYWRRALSSSDISALYNSGTPIFYDDLTDAQKIDLAVSLPLNEPVGIREDEHGSADLSCGAQSGASPVIRYSYSNKSITVNNQYGQLVLEVYHAESLDGGNTYNPVNSLLRRSTIDLTKTNQDTGQLLTTGTQEVYFQIDPPLTQSEDVNYMYILKYENDNTNTYSVLCYYSSDSAVAIHQQRTKRKLVDGLEAKEGFSRETAAMLDMEVFIVGDNDNAWVDGTITGNDKYSYQGLEAKTITPMEGQEQKEFNNDVEFKICIEGLEDDGSGTYTGSANALIENPSDIIRFVLLNSEFGVSLDAADIDETSFDNVRDSLVTMGLNKLKIAITSETTAKEFIADICRQSRIMFYINRSGKLALYFPEPLSSVDYIFSEASLKENGNLVRFSKKDYSSVINKCLQYYKPDILNVPLDPNLLKLEERERLVGKLELDATRSTMADDDRESIAETSQAIYGTRELTFDLNFHDDKQTAYKVQKYYFDRYNTLQSQVTYRVNRKDYLSLDLLEFAEVQDTALPSEYYSGLPSKMHYDSEEITTYFEGVPVVNWSGGSLKGQIVAIQEQGSDLLLTIETMNNFEA